MTRRRRLLGAAALVALVVAAAALAAPRPRVPDVPPAAPPSRDGAVAMATASAPVARREAPPRDGAAQAAASTGDRARPLAIDVWRPPVRPSAEDEAACVAAIADRALDDTTRNQAAELLIRWRSPRVRGALRERLDDAQESERYRSWTVEHLVEQARDGIAPDGVVDELRALLEDRHVAVRREALLGLHRLDEPSSCEIAARWLTTALGDGARDIAIAIIAARDGRQWCAAIRDRLADPDEATVIAAIQVAIAWRDAAAVPSLQRLRDAPRLRVRRAAQRALASLAPAP